MEEDKVALYNAMQDDILKCECGNDGWFIGDTGTACSRCGKLFPADFSDKLTN